MQYDQAMNWIQKKLQEAGYKITPPRKHITDWVVKKEGIFSAKEILEDVSLDKVSVYRTIDLLVSLDIIHPITQLHGEEHYETHEKKHHHHVVCTGCEKMDCISCDVRRKSVAGFKKLHHSVVFTGLCLSCDS